jgi:hypothetical protein
MEYVLSMVKGIDFQTDFRGNPKRREFFADIVEVFVREDAKITI